MWLEPPSSCGALCELAANNSPCLLFLFSQKNNWKQLLQLLWVVMTQLPFVWMGWGWLLSRRNKPVKPTQLVFARAGAGFVPRGWGRAQTLQKGLGMRPLGMSVLPSAAGAGAQHLHFSWSSSQLATAPCSVLPSGTMEWPCCSVSQNRSPYLITTLPHFPALTTGTEEMKAE